MGAAGRLDVRRPARRHPGVLQPSPRERDRHQHIAVDFAVYTALGWLYKTAVEVVMLPVTYRVIAYIKRQEPTYQPAV